MIIKGKFYHEKTIERKANELLHDYYKTDLASIELPVAIDKILELHLDINLLWEDFGSPDILAGLIPNEKKIVMNEGRMADFDKNKGWENYTKGHEVGHWILHVDEADMNSEPLPGFNRPYELICRSSDKDWDEINADKFASCLLMPKEHVIKHAKKIEEWSDIYNLAKIFNVSATAMKVRLEKLGLVFVDEHGEFYGSKEEYMGQGRLI